MSAESLPRNFPDLGRLGSQQQACISGAPCRPTPDLTPGVQGLSVLQGGQASKVPVLLPVSSLGLHIESEKNGVR